MRSTRWKKIVITGAALVVPVFAYAADLSQFFNQGGYLNSTGLPTDSPTTIVFNILKVFFQILGLIALLIIMYGGFTWMTASGNDDKIKKGRDILIWAFLGLLIILSSLGIVSYLDTVLTGATS